MKAGRSFRILTIIGCVLQIMLLVTVHSYVAGEDFDALVGIVRAEWAQGYAYRSLQLSSTLQESTPTASAHQSAAALSMSDPQVRGNFVYKERKWAGTCPQVKFKVNINTGQAGGADGSVEDFRNAIIAAAQTWNAVPEMNFVLTYDGPTDATDISFNGANEIMFVHRGLDQPAALARFWFTSAKTIVEADIWINNDYAWDTTGAPAPNEVDLQSVLLHELGHWLALGHDGEKEAAMHDTIPMGVLKRALHQNDMDGIRFIYPASTGTDCTTAPPSTTLYTAPS